MEDIKIESILRKISEAEELYIENEKLRMESSPTLKRMGPSPILKEMMQSDIKVKLEYLLMDYIARLTIQNKEYEETISRRQKDEKVS